MSYKKLIENKVKQAFMMVKDLAEDVMFTRKLNSEFDFETGTAESTPQSTYIKVVVMEGKKVGKVRNTVGKTLMAKTEDVGDMKLYETVSFNNQVWNIGAISKNDGFVTVFEVFREV